jgi:hypothetical protein
VLDQGVGEPAAAVDEQVAVAALLELRDNSETTTFRMALLLIQWTWRRA